ncbi:MAG: lysophospholipid acyltransferase family protein [Bacteroidales bacterium]|nr:lysophospholipid acyltransferase family protein [Bacteroidales bacterium]
MRSLANLLGLLPMRLLYLLADFLYFIAYYIIRYRQKVVRHNLQLSFPEKTARERKQIEKEFYHHFADLMAEYVKMTQVSEIEMQKRITIENPEILHELYDEGRSVFLALGHCGNWEWFGISFYFHTRHKPYAIYKRLSNPHFDDFVKSLRTAIGPLLMIESRNAYRSLKQSDDQPNAVVIAADQSPSGTEQDYWTNFLNQDTAFFTGLEKMAKALDYAVVFVENIKVKRGTYKVVLSPISLDPQKETTNYIIETYARFLEQAIVRNPSNWLWSHRRWKHQQNKSESHA